MADTLHASCGDLSLAYQVCGDGPVELVFVAPMISQVEMFWAMPEYKAFFDQLATFCRVVRFDKAGIGLSDPVPGTVKLVSCLVAAKIGGRDRCIVVVQGTPVPAGDHRPLRVAVSPVPAELS